MPKMSIKKKPPNTITRKKLFQFLFKNYIKSAYSGISKCSSTSSSSSNHSRAPRNISRQLLAATEASSAHVRRLANANEGGHTSSVQLQQQQHQQQPQPSTVNDTVPVVSSHRKREFRSEYFNDMSECFTESQRNRRKSSAVGDSTLKLVERSDTIKRGSRSLSKRRTMTVTQPMDNKIGQNDDIGWGKKVNVSLVREATTSFGVCIVGGKVNISKELQVVGIFIKNIIPNSPAELCRQIKIGDRILYVNQQDVRNASQEETISLIKNAGCRIDLVLQSFDGSDLDGAATTAPSTAVPPVPKKSTEVTLPSCTSGTSSSAPPAPIKSALKPTLSRPKEPSTVPAPSENAAPTAEAATKPTAVKTGSEDDSSSDDEDEETSGKVMSKKGFEIDRKSAGNLKRTKEEIEGDNEQENNFGYTDLKLKKKYGPLGGTIIRANIQRDTDNSMGLALAGHRDRNRMGCFVAGINPKGSASSQKVKVGDEILEINGVFLHKMCHLNASVIIKAIPGLTLEFIFLRMENAEESLAVKPVISFPSAFDMFDQLYSCFKNVRNVTIQKVGTSLGIMIIEGKHSDVGQGIFISDIQENSNAENAGVKIGEMILAVNKDLLIDTNYDTAAGLLKRAEGIVTLTLCNPNKKEGEAIEETKVEPVAVKKPEPPPEPEVPKDPATCAVEVNKETTIELNAEKKPLGIVVVKGDPSEVQVGASIILIHENGAVHKDGRMAVFDKIIEIDGKKMSSETSEHEINKVFQHIYNKVKLVVYRSEPLDLKEIEVDITKKSGKDIGIGFAECKDNGIYVTDIIPGGPVDQDKRMIRGDIVTHINGDDIRKSNFIESTILLKAAQPKIIFKVVRPKGRK